LKGETKKPIGWMERSDTHHFTSFFAASFVVATGSMEYYGGRRKIRSKMVQLDSCESKILLPNLFKF
jgi:hypothetical protein